MSTEKPREEVQPTEEDQPAEQGKVQPAEQGEVQPAEQGEVQPVPEDAEPSAAQDVEPSAAQDVEPSVGRDVERTPEEEGDEPAREVVPTPEEEALAPEEEAPAPEDEATDRGEGHPAGDPGRAWHRLLRAGAPRATRANLLAMVLAGSLGFAIIAQVRQTSIEGLENLREDDLVRIFAGVDRESDRLTEEIRELEASLERLRSQTTNDEEAQRSAQQRLDSLGILAGTAPASGPGIVLTIRDPERQVTAPMLLDAVQELRGAGAEAIQVGDVRVVADTWFTQADDGISVSGTVVRSPYVIRAIGDANTLAGAMEIPGGVTATVRRAGGESDIQIRDDVEVDALLTPSPPQYARPVPTSTS